MDDNKGKFDFDKFPSAKESKDKSTEIQYIKEAEQQLAMFCSKIEDAVSEGKLLIDIFDVKLDEKLKLNATKLETKGYKIQVLRSSPPFTESKNGICLSSENNKCTISISWKH